MNAPFGKPNPIAAISATAWQKIIYTITSEKKHKRFYEPNESQWWLTSIADIILYPHESIVSFHWGKPSGITGSELSSCTRDMATEKRV